MTVTPPSKFEFVNGHKLRKTVRAVIINDDGEFLLIQPHGYEADIWTLVGGGVEDGESDEQAMLREIREEAGITSLTGIQPSSAQHWYCFSERIKSERGLSHDGQIAKVFFISVPSGLRVTIQAEEVQAFCWAPLELVEALIKIPEQQHLFQEVISEFLEHPNLRSNRR